MLVIVIVIVIATTMKPPSPVLPSRLLPFDAHNHIHMGPSEPIVAVVNKEVPSEPLLSGVAIMSTHPKDYPTVSELQESLPKACPGLRVVPCFGVHPWWLHELTEEDWKPIPIVPTESIHDLPVSGIGAAAAAATTTTTTKTGERTTRPAWVVRLEERIRTNPLSIVGEIGLDGFHFDPKTGDLTSSIEEQVKAFELMMGVAVRQDRPVSIHAVQSFGPLMESLSRLKKKKNKKNKNGLGLPPKMYFHAFGGKEGTVDQLTALCGRKQGSVYFGFAPVVNFRSNKTFKVIRKVGLNRLVLETDHEDAGLVLHSMEEGIRLVAEALEESEERVVEVTTRNAFDLYGLGSGDGDLC